MKRFAVVGSPIAHSRSPEIFGVLAAASGAALSYERIEIAPNDFSRVFAAARTAYDGWNVTAPHKERALASADEVSADARVVGAANVVTFRDGRAAVANTDVEGVIALLRSCAIDPAGVAVTVLGAGGAARAVVLALAQLGAARVAIVNRSPGRAAALIDDLRGAVGPLELIAGTPAEPAPLVINATSDGGAVAGAIDGCTQGGWCVDLQYRPAETPFVRAARAAGRRSVNGTTMLVAQAVATFRLWFDGSVRLDAGAVAPQLAAIVEAA